MSFGDRFGAAFAALRGEADPAASFVRVPSHSASRDGSPEGSEGEGGPESVLSSGSSALGVPGEAGSISSGRVEHLHLHQNIAQGKNSCTRVANAVMLLASLAFLAFAICYSQGFFPFETFMGPIGSSVSIGSGCLFVGLSACIMLTN